MRVPQHLRGALAICGRWTSARDSRRARRCSGAGRRWKRAGASRLSARDRRRRRGDQAHQRAGDLSAHLVDEPFQQPLGRRRLRDVWSRQLRWARLRRVTFPLFFVPEILTTSLFSLAAAGVAAPCFRRERRPRRRRDSGFLVRRRGCSRFALAGWPLSWRTPFAWAVRDLMLPGAIRRGLDRRQRRLARQRHERRRN